MRFYRSIARFAMRGEPVERLDDQFADLGELALDRSRPPAPSGPPDIGRMVAIADKHGIEVTGPPPM